jgi:hypothetical protein
MKIENLCSLIRESINEYINKIDEEGNAAMYTAKKQACEEAIRVREEKLTRIDESDDLKELVHPEKIKEIKREIADLQKYKVKVERLEEKARNKGKKKVTTDAETDDKDAAVDENDILDEMDLEESTKVGGEFGGNRVPKKSKDSDNNAFFEKKRAPKGKFKDKSSKGYFELDEDDMPKVQKLRSSGEDDNWNDDQRGLSANSAWLEDNGTLEERTLNESFLKMQKLAGVITESEYKKKINETLFLFSDKKMKKGESPKEYTDKEIDSMSLEAAKKLYNDAKNNWDVPHNHKLAKRLQVKIDKENSKK